MLHFRTDKAGDAIRIIGKRMKFDPANADCGVFLETDNDSFRVQVYPDIAPSKLIAILPDTLAPDTLVYDLVVSTSPNGKDLKEGYYEQQLTIA